VKRLTRSWQTCITATRLPRAHLKPNNLLRYSNAAPGACFLRTLALTGSGISKRRQMSKVSENGGSATVTFTKNGAPEYTVNLLLVRGRWLIDLRSWLRVDSLRVNVSGLQDFTGSCLAAWNHAIKAGQVVLPMVPERSQSTWADLGGNGSKHSPCLLMTIVIPSKHACEQYFENQPSTWTSGKCSDRVARGILNRNVWLTHTGKAVPASDTSPDGNVPSIKGLGKHPYI
jgi:hypothetical protein